MRLAGLLCCVWTACALADPPTTQPANLSERQASILLQLSNAEANIKAINKALVRTGYKVGLAYDQIENTEKANELMDRKGGGPVPWDEFYGKTAMSFYHHASADLHVNVGRGAETVDAQWTGGRLTRVNRPRQFDYIYNANNQQAAKAQDQIASLLQDQTALLARRQKHETEQSSLWAEFAWEQLRDREIAFRPIYRFALTPDGGRTGLLRGPMLFLRTTDAAVSAALDGIELDQPGTFVDLRQRTREAYAALQATMANALVVDGLKTEDVKTAEAIKALCKSVAEQCVVTDDNFRLAAESDRSKEDASKLEYRAALQASLGKLAILTADLDGRIGDAATAWGVKPRAGTESPDKTPKFAARTEAVAPPPPIPVVASTPTAPTPPVPAPPAAAEGHWIDLFNGRDTSGWKVKGPRDHGTWTVKNGALVSDGGPSALVTVRDDFANVRIRVEAMINDGGNSGVFFRCQGGEGIEFSRYEAQIESTSKDPNKTGSIYVYDVSQNKRSSVPASFRESLVPAMRWMTMEIVADGSHIVVTVDGTKTADFVDSHFVRGAVGLQQHDRDTSVRVRKVQVMELAK